MVRHTRSQVAAIGREGWGVRLTASHGPVWLPENLSRSHCEQTDVFLLRNPTPAELFMNFMFNFFQEIYLV